MCAIKNDNNPFMNWFDLSNKKISPIRENISPNKIKSLKFSETWGEVIPHKIIIKIIGIGLVK